MKTFEDRKSPQNLFTLMDKQILTKALLDVLSSDEIDLIILVFWKNKLLHEVAHANSVSIAYLQRKLNSALSKIKIYCLNHPEFSRSIISPLLAA